MAGEGASEIRARVLLGRDAAKEAARTAIAINGDLETAKGIFAAIQGRLDEIKGLQGQLDQHLSELDGRVAANDERNTQVVAHFRVLEGSEKPAAERLRASVGEASDAGLEAGFALTQALVGQEALRIVIGRLDTVVKDVAGSANRTSDHMLAYEARMGLAATEADNYIQDTYGGSS